MPDHSAPAVEAGSSARPVRAGWTLLLASIGAFVASLDVVVVSTALPTLRADLHAGLSDLEWTINAYNLAFASLLLTGAALGDRFGRRRMYVTGLGLFTIGSAACALSTSIGTLITARVGQGVGAAILLPLTLALISDAFPAEKRGAAIGIWGGVSGLGVAAGPVVGGAITEAGSWQWIFWINVPIGLLALLLSSLLLRESYGPRPQLDVVGLLLGAFAVLELTWAPARGPLVGWGSREVVGAVLTGALALAAFLAWERRTPFPMLPLAYFRRRGFSTANAVALCQAASLIGSLFLIAQLLQIGFGYGPLAAGLRILVWTAMPMLVAPFAGRLADRFGNRPFMVAGLLLQGGGLLWLASATEPGGDYGHLVIPLILAGVGTALCFPTVANAVVDSVPPTDSAVAAGANNALREVGGVFGVAVVAAVFSAAGDYSSPARFISGFKAAELVAAVVALAGVLAAGMAPSGRPLGERREEASAANLPGLPPGPTARR